MTGIEIYIALVVANVLGVVLGLAVGRYLTDETTKAMVGGGALGLSIGITVIFFALSVVPFSTGGIIMGVATSILMGVFIGVGIMLEVQKDEPDSD